MSRKAERSFRVERTVTLGILALAVLVLFWRPLLGRESLSVAGMARLFSPWVEHARPGYSPPDQSLGDTLNSGLPALVVFRHALAGGHFALWNPLVGLGTPLGGSLTKPLLSPFAFADVLLPLWYGPGLGIALRLVVLLAGTYLFARELGLRPAAAGVAAAAFGFCGFNTAWLLFPQTYVIAFLPLTLLLAERALRRGSLLAIAGVALCCYGLISGAFPFVAVLALAFVGGYVVLRLFVGTPVAPRARWQPAAAVLAFCGLGIVMSAALVIPLARELREADLGYYRPTTYSDALPGQAAWRLLVPNIYGTGNGYFGPINGPETSIYVGLAPLLAALSVPFVRRRSGLAIAFLAAGVFAMALSLKTPVWHLLRPLPPFSSNPSGRANGIGAFALAMAAGFAVDAAVRPGTWAVPALRRVAAFAVGGTALAAALFWVARSVVSPSGYDLRNPDVHYARTEVLVTVVLLGAIVGVAFVLWRRLVPAPVAGIAVLVLSVVQLVRLAEPAFPASRVADTLPPATSIAALPKGSTRVAGVELAGYPNMLGAYGVSDIRAHKLPTAQERALFARLDPIDQPSPTYLRLSPQADFTSPWLRLLGVSRILAPLGQDPIGQSFTDAVAASTRTVVGATTVLDFDLSGPTSGFGLYATAVDTGAAPDALRTPPDPARLRAEISSADGQRRTVSLGFADMVVVPGRINFMFPPLGSGPHHVRIAWDRPPRSARPLELTDAQGGGPAVRQWRTGPLPVTHVSDAVVYGLADPLPEAMLYREWRKADDKSVIDGVADGSVDIGRTLLLDRDLAPGPGGPATPLLVERDGTDHVQVRLPANGTAGVVLVRDGWSSGWRASVDGHRVALLRGDALLRAIPVPAGARTVDLSYRPAGWPYAVWLSVFAFLVDLGVLAIGWRTRRRPLPFLAPVSSPR